MYRNYREAWKMNWVRRSGYWWFWHCSSFFSSKVQWPNLLKNHQEIPGFPDFLEGLQRTISNFTIPSNPTTNRVKRFEILIN
jgi:hypothetical protein